MAKLEAQYKPLLTRKYLSLNAVDVSPLIADLVHLGVFPQLAGMYLNYHFQLLQLTKEKWETEKIEVTLQTRLRSWLIPQYTNLQMLTDIITRDQAIQLFKHHITQYMRRRIADHDERFQTLEELREDFLQMEAKDTGVEGVVGEVEGGKLIWRRDCCHLDAALADLTDRELKYLVCCFGDFEGVRTFNKCLKLTMEHTIAAGDPYCDCVYYDTRITEDFTHPPKEFFDSIWPLPDRE